MDSSATSAMETACSSLRLGRDVPGVTGVPGGAANLACSKVRILIWTQAIFSPLNSHLPPPALGLRAFAGQQEGLGQSLHGWHGMAHFYFNDWPLRHGSGWFRLIRREL